MNSDLDWSIMCPAGVQNPPHTGRCRASTDLRIRLTSVISGGDLAGFLPPEATPVYVCQFPRSAA